MKRKIGIVNQRYGPEVNGGSELYARLIAERLKDRYDVEVITTTALDYDTWKNYYPAGVEEVHGIPVRRFPVERERGLGFRIVNKLMRLRKTGLCFLDRYWVEQQGPYCPKAVQYLVEHRNNYDAVIFVTYLYYLTVAGLPELADKAILVPTAHDEYCIYFHIYERIFQSPRAVIYLTEEEKKLVNRLFHNENIANRVLGVGVDLPKETDGGRFRKKYGIEGEYFIYAGRVDRLKNCHRMIEYFKRYRETEGHLEHIRLVIVGKVMMEIDPDPGILCLGFVEEQDKYDGISGARALLLPSKYESLSIAVLEAFALGKPVVVNGKCEVLKAHCQKSGAGLSFGNEEEFITALTALQKDSPEYMRMCSAGREYIDRFYCWRDIIKGYEELIEYVIGE